MRFHISLIKIRVKVGCSVNFPKNRYFLNKRNFNYSDLMVVAE